MHKKKNHITKSKDYQRYLDGTMTSKERHAFEKRMLEDDFENEALEGLSEIESNELIKDLSHLSERIQAKSEKSSGFIYWRIAASLLILAVFSFAIYFMIDIDAEPKITQSKQVPEPEKTVISDEEKEVYSDSVTDESVLNIANHPNVDKMKEAKPAVSNKETSGKKVQILADEEVAVLEPNLSTDIAEVNDELIIEESSEDIEIAQSIDNDVQGELNSLDLVISEAPNKKDLQPIKVEEEAATERMPISKPLAGRVAGVSVQSSRKSQSKMASNIEGIKTITGNVYSSEDDEVLPGVNIVVKGSSTGVVTDIEGNYQIAVPANEDVTLVFSYIGFNSAEVEVADQETIDVNIEPDLTALSEIVVVGYGVSADNAEESYAYTPPRPEGGKSNFRDYVKKNITYPASAVEHQTKGTVKLKFKVGVDGQISDLEVLKSLGNDFDKEAIRLVKEGPKWEPATENSNSVVREVKVKVRFRPME